MLFPVQHEDINSGAVSQILNGSRWIVHISLLHKTKCANLNQTLIFSAPLATISSHILLNSAQNSLCYTWGEPGPPRRPDTWHDWLCDISVFETVSRWSCEVGSHTDEPTAASLHLPHTHNSCEPDAGQNLGPFKWKLLMLKTQKGQKFVRFTPRRTSRVSAGINAFGKTNL